MTRPTLKMALVCSENRATKFSRRSNLVSFTSMKSSRRPRSIPGVTILYGIAAIKSNINDPLNIYLNEISFQSVISYPSNVM